MNAVLDRIEVIQGVDQNAIAEAFERASAAPQKFFEVGGAQATPHNSIVIWAGIDGRDKEIFTQDMAKVFASITDALPKTSPQIFRATFNDKVFGFAVKMSPLSDDEHQAMKRLLGRRDFQGLCMLKGLKTINVGGSFTDLDPRPVYSH